MNRKGFTIVELLIVIVVISILAAISIVAYNGIQDRANNTAVQSDLSNLGKYLKLKIAETGNIPSGGAVRTAGVDSPDVPTTFPGIKYKTSQDAYLSGVTNLYYCSGTETTTGQESFRLMARSKSGDTYKYSSNGSIVRMGQGGVSSGVCLQEYGNEGTWAYGRSPAGTWYDWANG